VKFGGLSALSRSHTITSVSIPLPFNSLNPFLSILIPQRHVASNWCSSFSRVWTSPVTQEISFHHEFIGDMKSAKLASTPQVFASLNLQETVLNQSQMTLASCSPPHSEGHMSPQGIVPDRERRGNILGYSKYAPEKGNMSGGAEG